MAFRGEILSAFGFSGQGTVFLVRLEEGVPQVGDLIETDQGRTVISALDDRGVRERSCLTGVPIQPQIGVVTELPFVDGKGWEKKQVTGGSPEDMTHKAGESDV